MSRRAKVVRVVGGLLAVGLMVAVGESTHNQWAASFVLLLVGMAVVLVSNRVG